MGLEAGTLIHHSPGSQAGTGLGHPSPVLGTALLLLTENEFIASPAWIDQGQAPPWEAFPGC